jgi:hypothetical protein
MGQDFRKSQQSIFISPPGIDHSPVIFVSHLPHGPDSELLIRLMEAALAIPLTSGVSWQESAPPMPRDKFAIIARPTKHARFHPYGLQLGLFDTHFAGAPPWVRHPVPLRKEFLNFF